MAGMVCTVWTLSYLNKYYMYQTQLACNKKAFYVYSAVGSSMA